MTRRGQLAQLVLRRTALLLALTCLWMSSGAALRHTDDLSVFRTFAAGRSAVAPPTPMPADVPCVAHEWMNAWQTLPTAHVSVVHTLVLLTALRQIPSLALHLRSFDFVSLRGPPSVLS